MTDLREAILGKDDLPGRMLELPAWGMTIWVRALDAATTLRFGSLATGAGEGGNVSINPDDLAAVVVNSACDPNTKQPLFSAADSGEILTKDLQTLLKIFYAALKLTQLEAETAAEN